MRSFIAKGGLWVLGQGLIFAAVAAGLWWGGSADAAPVLVAVGVAVAIAGSALAGDGVLRIRRHITALPAPVVGAPLVDSGAFGLARHPIYGGLVIAALGLAIARASVAGIAGAVVLGAFFVLKSSHEEQRLEEAYPDYEAYLARIRWRLIPWVL